MLLKSTLSAAVLAISAGAAYAGSCGYDYCYGAVAIGPRGAYAYSYHYPSAQAAYDAAQDSCNWGCDVVKTFYNTCGAIAQADNGAWGWGWESTAELAQSTAMNYCMDVGRNCQVRVWACSK